MHRVREIDRRRAHRQIDDLALRREDVDGVGEEAAPERGEPLGRVGDRIFPVEHLPQPRDAVLECGIAARALLRALLVPPMRGDAVFGMLVHLARADLHLERLAFGTDHRRVQRSVVVGLRLRDVVVELARQRRPQMMDDAERGVAVLDVVDQDPHGADVVQAVDARLLAAHLVPDAVDVLRPAGDLRAHAGRRELAREDAQ